MDDQQNPLPADDEDDANRLSGVEPDAADADAKPVREISLLDLMREETGELPPAKPETTSVRQPAPPAVNLPARDPLDAPHDDATTTLPPAPPPESRPTTVPTPFFAEDLQPTRRPPEQDDDATQVQPRVAFPDHTQLNLPASSPDEAPTLPPRRRTDTPPTQPRRLDDRRIPSQATGPRRHIPPPQTRASRPRPETGRVVPPRTQVVPRPKPRRHWGRTLLRAFLITLLVAVIGVSLSLVGVTAGYIIIGSQLPRPNELRARASTFETARIYDRDGGLLYSLADPNTGNRTYVTLDQISPHLINATIATEDSRFYTNPGFDPAGIARALWQAAREREFVSGASTITQQLVRAVLLDETERTERTFTRKMKEIVLAAEISRTYSKETILELYLNEINYGNRAYGIEAAAQTYFRKPAAELTLSEASLLAGLPQAPALWDPYSAPDRALGRQSEVLGLMVATGMITLPEAQAALNESNLVVYNLQPPQVTIKHPHFTLTVLQQLEQTIGSQAIYRGGLRVFTTLDPGTQALAEQTLANHRNDINAAGANNAAMVVMSPATGEVIALVGSVDFDDEAISGQVNMALAQRQPGSAIKPLVYLAAFEKGWTPSTLIWDIETQFPDGTNPPYVPKNYDDRFHGPTLLRLALGNSYNIPAIKALEFVGVCPFVARLNQLGFGLNDEGCTTIGQPRDVGLALAVGGGGVTPLEMASGFSMLANGGVRVPPFTIRRIENRQGEVLFEQAPPDAALLRAGRPEHAYLLSHILSDNNARQPGFGLNNNLVIPGHIVAAKTGTSGSTRFDVRDGWTIGFTPEVTTAVWVGNTDNEPVGEGMSGYRMASPIWNEFMTAFLAGREPRSFPRPAGIVEAEICADSGTRPSPACRNRSVELFASDQPPLPADQDFLQQVNVDLWTNLRANEACPEAVFPATFAQILVSGDITVHDRERELARRWLEGPGRAWAEGRGIAVPLRFPPQESCTASTARPRLAISQPGPGSQVNGRFEIFGTATGPNFAGFRLEYGLSHDPGGWGLIQDWTGTPVENGLLAVWDAEGVAGGPITLRLTLAGPDNPYTPESDRVMLETRVPLSLLEPTATPSPTPTQTATPTVTPTASPSPTVTSTAGPTATPTVRPEATATPTLAPGPTATPSPTDTPGSDEERPPTVTPALNP